MDERKYRLRPDRVPRLLFELSKRGATPTQTKRRTVMFDDTGRHLQREGRSLGLRTGGDRLELVASAPPAEDAGGEVPSEVTATVEGPVEQVLAAAGLRPVEQRRRETELYQFAEIRVSVENVEPIGWFCEIAATKKGASIDLIAAELGLEPSAVETRSYAELLALLPRPRPVAETETGRASYPVGTIAVVVILTFALVAVIGYSGFLTLALAVIVLAVVLRLLGVAPAWLRG